MKAKRIIARLFLLPLLTAAALTSCISDEIQVDVPRGNAREMVFKISVSGGTPHTTRAIAEGSANDNALHDLLFLQFGSDDKLLPNDDGYSVISANLTPETGADAPIANTYTVRVALHVDARKALVVANWGAYKGSTTVYSYLIYSLQGKTITQIAEGDNLFEYDRSPRKDFTTDHPYHLMGSQPFTIPPVGTTATVQLIRSLAKINVTVASNLTVTGSAGEGGQLTAANGFKLKTIKLVNANHRARVLPPTSTAAGAQNIPTNPQKQIGYNNSLDPPITYDAGGATSLIDNIFLPEIRITGTPDDFTGSTDWMMAPTLLIEATMNLDGTPVDRWFRVNLRMADATDGGKLKHVDILRNHKYTVNITGIGGMGYDDPANAFANLPGDLIVSLTATEEDPDLTNIVYDGQHYLASNAPFEYDGAEHDGTLKLFTDFDDGWTIESITGNDDGWLTGSDIAIRSNGDDNTVAALNFHVATNTSGNPRTAVITVSAGTLTQEVEVRQGTTPATTLTVTPLFHSFEWDAFSTSAAAKEFTVTTDGAWTASITNVSTDAATNFTLTAGTGVTISGTGTATVISGMGNGTFSVAPKSNNTGTTVDREFTITVTATGTTAPEAAPKTVTVTQWKNNGLRPGALAAPGVIGYIKGTNQLTIRGSKEFLGSMVMTDPNNHNIETSTTLATGQPLEDATVYVAYFKFGSLVATRSENVLAPTGIASTSFIPQDVVAIPSQWSGTITNWASIPGVEETDNMTKGQELSTLARAVPANGMGDPCDYWFGEEGYGLGDGNGSTGSGWKLPTAVSGHWYDEGGAPFTRSGITDQWTDPGLVAKGSEWINSNDPERATLPVNGAVAGSGSGTKDWSMFLPETSHRSDNGQILFYPLSTFNTGKYQSSTAEQGNKPAFYTLSFSSSTVTAKASYLAADGVAVRCVKPRVVQWRFTANGTLTLPEDGYYYIEAWGGNGGVGGNSAGAINTSANGGPGVRSTKQVVLFSASDGMIAGNVLYIQTGENGGQGTHAINSGGSAGQAGGAGGTGTYFGNGGNGGTGGNGVTVNSGGGGGGGGGSASGVLLNGTTTSHIIFAAGGAGGSGAAGGDIAGGAGFNTLSPYTSTSSRDGGSGGNGADGGLFRRGAGGGGGGGGGSDLSAGGGGFPGSGGPQASSVQPGTGGYAGKSSNRNGWTTSFPSEVAPYIPNNTRPNNAAGSVVITLIRTK